MDRDQHDRILMIPAMCVVVYMARGSEKACGLTIDSLCAQTAHERLEVIVITEKRTTPVHAARTDALHSIRVIEIGTVGSIAEAMAAGVREATAPLVAFAGNHSYPEPDWAARLIEAHQGPWAGVGPSELNANPTTAVSWAHFLIGHGRWIFPVDRGAVDLLPMRNAAFKRSLLLGYGTALERALERDGGLAQSLRRRELGLLLEPDARIHHFNVSRLPSFLRFRFAVGRAYAASRAARHQWSAARRGAYALGWPLIPLVQLRGVIGWIRRCDAAHNLMPRVLPAVALGLAATAAGEAAGYLAGFGGARLQILRFESDLDPHMTRVDRDTRAAGLVFGERSA